MIFKTKASQSAALWAASTFLLAIVALFPLWSLPYFYRTAQAEVTDFNPVGKNRSFDYKYSIRENTYSGTGYGSAAAVDYKTLKVGFRLPIYYHPLVPFYSEPDVPYGPPFSTFAAALFIAVLGGIWRFAHLGTKLNLRAD